jgi:uncharacterized surface anchored protein
MTRTGVMASSRPSSNEAGSKGATPSGVMRRLSSIAAVMLLAMALVAPGSAFAASEPTSGYNQTPTTPKSGTEPSKEESKPTSTTPTSTTPTSTTPTTTSTPSEAKKASLPFTGFDLRWSLAIGLVLMGAGFSIVVVQRRQRGSGSR